MREPTTSQNILGGKRCSASHLKVLSTLLFLLTFLSLYLLIKGSIFRAVFYPSIFILVFYISLYMIPILGKDIQNPNSIHNTVRQDGWYRRL